MARGVAIKIDVDAQQFHKFAQDFTALSSKMDDISSQFINISQSVEKSTQAIVKMQGSMNKVLNMTQNIGTSVGRITVHFAKWAGLMGGITTLFAAGGLERLSEKVLQQRKRASFLGTDIASMQAADIAGKSVFDDPAGFLNKIGKAKLDIMGGGISLGRVLGGKDYTKMEPPDIAAEIVKRIPEAFKDTPQGLMGIRAKAGGWLDVGLSLADIQRLRDPAEAKKYREELKNKPGEVDKSAAETWADFNKALSRLTTTMENQLINKLSPLAKHLTDFTEGLIKLIKMFDLIPMTKATGDTAAKGLGELFGVTKEKWDEHGGKLLSNPKGWISETLNEFTGAVRSTINALRAVSPLLLGRAQGGSKDGTGAAPGGPEGGKGGGGGFWNNFMNLLGKGGDILSYLGPNAANASPRAPQTSTSTQSPTTQPPTTQPPTVNPPSPAQPGFTFNPNATPNVAIPAVPYGNTFTIPRASPRDPRDYGGLGGSLPFGLPSTHGMPFNKSSWNDAAGSRVPGPGSRGGAIMNQMAGAGGGSRNGPLSNSNWQMNRVATLRIDNVPGANVFMTAGGMAG